jgi:uncharacterized protein (DUF58 family)
MQTKRKGEECVSVSLSELLLLSKSARELSFPSQIRSVQSGQNSSRLLGRGMVYAESRRYQYGDESRNIDWRVTARTGRAHTKLFEEEKERQVLICVDMRSSMFFATQGVFKSVQAALMSGALAWNAVQGGNRLGGIIFDDYEQFDFRPALGKRGVLPFLQSLASKADHLASLNKQPKSSSMDEAINNLKRVVAPGSLVFIISDFRQFSSHAKDLLVQLSTHSDLRLCFIYDGLEAALPKNGVYPITDGQSYMELNTHDTKKLENYHQKFIDRKDSVASLRVHPHIHFMECKTEDDFLYKLKEKGSFK